QLRSRTQVRSSAYTERVLEASLQLPSPAEPRVLREYMVTTAARIFRPIAAGIFEREGEGYQPVAVATGESGTGMESLLAHARSFAAQAVEQKRLLNFRSSSRPSEGEPVYQGLAHPLIPAQATAVLLIVRGTPFLPAETSAFAALGNVARLALDNAELNRLYSTQKRELDQLLEISGELGTTSRLEAFLPRFVVRAADFLGFSRAFV